MLELFTATPKSRMSIVIGMPRNIQTTDADRAIAAIIKGYARTLGVTQDEIAATTGIPLVGVQRLFSGKSAWKTSQLLDVAAAIGGPKDASTLLDEAVAFIPHLPAVSEAATTTDDLERKRRQRQAAAMTVEELEQLSGAATRDAELDSDEPDLP